MVYFRFGDLMIDSILSVSIFQYLPKSFAWKKDNVTSCSRGKKRFNDHKNYSITYFLVLLHFLLFYQKKKMPEKFMILALFVSKFFQFFRRWSLVGS